MILAINTVLPLALAVIMFALGLGLTIADFRRIAQNPRAFAIGAFAQMVVLPLTAFAVAALFALPPELALGLVILSLCPGGPSSSIFVKLGKGDVALSISLTAAVTFVSVFTIPVLAAFAARHFLGLEAGPVDVSQLAVKMVLITIVPAVAGMLLRRIMPQRVGVLEPMISRLALLVVACLIATAFVLNWTAFMASIGALFAACLVIMGAMLLTGLLLGRVFQLDKGATTSIAVDTAMQNGAMGIIISTLIVSQPDTLSLISVPSGVYGVLMYFACLPFVLWRAQKSG